MDNPVSGCRFREGVATPDYIPTCTCKHPHAYIIAVSAQEDDIILVRTEPDPTSQELPCANQIIVYECQQLISSIELPWTLPNNETLRFSILRDINDTETSDDDNYIATLTNKTEGDLTDTFLFTSTLMILEPVNGSTVTCKGGTTSKQVSNDTTTILSGRSLLCV